MILLIFRSLAPLIQRSQSRPMWTILVVIVIYQTSLQYETLKHSWNHLAKRGGSFSLRLGGINLIRQPNPIIQCRNFVLFALGPWYWLLWSLSPLDSTFCCPRHFWNPSQKDPSSVNWGRGADVSFTFQCQHGALLWKPRDLPLVQFHSAPEPKWTKGAEHSKISCDSILYLYHPELKRRSNINMNLDVYIYTHTVYTCL